MIKKIKASIDYFLDNIKIRKINYIIHDITIANHNIYICYSPTHGNLSTANSVSIENIKDDFECFSTIDKYKLDIASAYQEILDSIKEITTNNDLQQSLLKKTENIILSKLGE